MPRSAAWFVSALHRRALDVLASVIPAHRPAVLLDYPDPADVGAQAIWLGQLALLRRLGVRVSSYSSSAEDLDLDQVRAAAGGGTILLSGGSTFGDLSPRTQELRERIVSAFPNNRIVQLSQSLCFRSRESLDHARRIFDRHPKFTLLVRDQASLAIAQRELSVRALLCPDMAFGLGPQTRSAAASVDVVVLSRTDRELSDDGPIEAAPARLAPHLQVEQDDWLDMPPMRWTRRAERFDQFLRRHPRAATLLTRLRAPLYERVARLRLQFGTQFLSRGRVVVTDRLHGHILCLLLDIPHVFLDSATHKNRQFHESWTQGGSSVRWCDEPSQAVRVAQDLL